MWNSKNIYYISDSTGILAETLGRALTCQFPEISFTEHTFPFIQTVEEAQETLDKILQESSGLQPIIFSTLMNSEVRQIFDHANVEFFDGFASHLNRLANCLEANPLRVPGYTHHQEDTEMDARVEAINFCMEHDDGSKTKEYDQADIIILGVSRAGKTPVSVYLATHMGFKTANFPLTDEYLSTYYLPEHIINNKTKAVGLMAAPEILHQIREKRYANSNYAKMATCREEVQQAQQIFLKYDIPYISSTKKSIEEISAQICKELAIERNK
jgi:regulator of PEP synthase PpsR (kinase-PPPase family)